MTSKFPSTTTSTNPSHPHFMLTNTKSSNNQQEKNMVELQKATDLKKAKFSSEFVLIIVSYGILNDIELLEADQFAKTAGTRLRQLP